MKYCISDVHGEYALFGRFLDKLHFSSKDELYICGDIIDKGNDSIRLAKYISSFPNMHCIIGNHEFAFLKYYHSILQTSPEDFDVVLQQLQAYFPQDGYLLDWDLVDWLESLPAYIEEKDFICVHAGVPMDACANLLPLSAASIEQLVQDRRFKEPDVIHNSPKCVFFGHTQTDAVCGENKILTYPRTGVTQAKTVRDYYKIHLDTGAWQSGVLGGFCIDTLESIYVK